MNVKEKEMSNFNLKLNNSLKIVIYCLSGWFSGWVVVIQNGACMKWSRYVFSIIKYFNIEVLNPKNEIISQLFLILIHWYYMTNAFMYLYISMGN